MVTPAFSGFSILIRLKTPKWHQSSLACKVSGNCFRKIFCASRSAARVENLVTLICQLGSP